MRLQLLTVAARRFGYWNDGTVEVDKYLGTEIEGTLSWTLHPGVNLDFIGSVVLAGDGLTDLLEQQGAIDPRIRSGRTRQG